MAVITEVLKMIQNKFGRKDVNPGDISELDNIESNVKKMYNNASKNFDESIRVEGIKSTVDPNITPNYQSLNRADALNIETFFRNMTREDFENYQEIEKSEGISTGGEPFKCYAEIDGNGNIIVTPNKAISIKQNKDGSEQYSETRNQRNGDFVNIMFKKLFGDIINSSVTTFSSDMSPEDINKYTKLSEFYSNPNNFQKLELSKKSSEEQSIYLHELQKLGIQNRKYGRIEDLSEEEYKAKKERGELSYVSSSSSYQVGESFKNVNVVYTGKNSIPEAIWTTETGPNGENLKLNSYRLTNDGRYFDTSSFRIVNGEPQYNVMDKKDLDKMLIEQGINIFSLYKTQEIAQKQLKSDFPQEAVSISEHAERMRKREKKEKEQSDDEPHLPNLY